MPCQTGYDNIMAQRVDEIFCANAQQEGKVTSITDDFVTITYKDGTVHNVEIGMRYGKSEGSVYPHPIIHMLKVGERVEEGDAIAWNANFFRPTPHNKKLLTWRSGVLGRCAFVESNATFEDSNTMSESFSKHFDADITKMKDVVVPFTSAVHNLVKVGAALEYNDILCSIEEKVGEDSLFDDDTSSLLKDLTKSSPKAGVHGTVEKIEFFYRGDKPNMDPTLRKLADTMDKSVKAKSQVTGSKVDTARVDGSLRIDGNSLLENHCVIRIYLNYVDDTKTADKFVVANQLKTTMASTHSDAVKTKSGQPIDMYFGGLSVSNRIVESTDLIGVISTICDTAADLFYKIYKG